MSAQHVKVLLIEDNPSDRRLIEESLGEAREPRFDLETAGTLASGLERLGAGGVDALLLDLALPDSFGQETFVRAKAQAMGVAIIVLTGLNDDSLALKLVQGGAQDFVAKVDVSGNNLTRAILYAIEREHLELEYRSLNEQLERRVRERTADLEASNKQLEAFSYSVSHDLRSPLAQMTGFTDLLLLTHAHQLDPHGQGLVRKIQDSAFRMSDLIDDLIRLAKVSRQGLTVAAVGLDALVADVLSEMQEQCRGRKIDWRIEPLPVVTCDYGLMKQVFANLIGNAIKYTRRRETALIEIGVTRARDEAVFFVRDNGVGFDMSGADRLFAPFQRLHTDAEFEGTGIGLATVQRIIDKHKGRIWAHSQPGMGTTFFFTLACLEGERSGTVAGAPVSVPCPEDAVSS